MPCIKLAGSGRAPVPESYKPRQTLLCGHRRSDLMIDRTRANQPAVLAQQRVNLVRCPRPRERLRAGF